MNTNKFFTKQGWLKRYGMACGYKHVSGDNYYEVHLSMNNAELDTYDIRTFHRYRPETNVWLTVEGIQAARDMYYQYCYGWPDKRYEANQDIRQYVYA